MKILRKIDVIHRLKCFHQKPEDQARREQKFPDSEAVLIIDEEMFKS